MFVSIFFISVLNCQEYSYDPWGVWNSYPVDLATAKVRVIGDEKYYEAGSSGIRIMKDRNQNNPNGEHFPAIAVPGEYNRIEKYEKTDYGFLFSMIGEGSRRGPPGSNIYFLDTIRIQIKMIFISSDECRFEFVSKVDENGLFLSLLYLPDEEVIYRRYRADDSESVDPSP